VRRVLARRTTKLSVVRFGVMAGTMAFVPTMSLRRERCKSHHQDSKHKRLDKAHKRFKT